MDQDGESIRNKLGDAMKITEFHTKTEKNKDKK